MGDGETALITGASAGIGEALAREFAARGHDVVLVARRERRLEALAADLEADGVTATPVPMDLDQAAAAEELYAAVHDRGLDVRILVNNVGVGAYGPFAENDLDAERSQLQLNVVLPVELTRLFLDDFGDGGKVLNVGSTSGFMPGPYLAGYYASKAYLNSFSQALSEELRGSPVDVTVLCPGPVETEFHARSDMQDSPVALLAADTRERVAAAGYEGLLAGETVVFPSRAVRALDLLLRVTPRPIVRRIVHWIDRGP